MPQIFPRSANVLAPLSLIGLLGLAAAGIGLLMGFDRSDYNTDRGLHVQQPVQFSHQHHVSGLGIHCVYCHSSVEMSASASIPATHTCMSCHSQIWLDSPMLEPVRASYRTGESIPWVRVHDLPEFVFFNHSAHVAKGIGCTSCHGDIGQMNLTRKAATLQMQWCLDCHEHPEQHVRPKERIFDPNYFTPAPDQASLGPKLVAAYGVRSLLDCYTCHR